MTERIQDLHPESKFNSELMNWISSDQSYIKDKYIGFTGNQVSYYRINFMSTTKKKDKSKDR